MSAVFPEPDYRHVKPGAILSALCLTVLLFCVVALAQYSKAERPNLFVREMVISRTPPKPPPQMQEEKKVEVEPPELKPELKELSLSEIELSLNPGIADALAMGVSLGGIQMKVDTIGEIEEVFTFEDLDDVPRIMHAPSFDFPRKLIRRGVREGRAVILVRIDREGRAELEEVVSISHPEFRKGLKKWVSRIRFSIPRKNGKPESVTGKVPLVFTP